MKRKSAPRARAAARKAGPRATAPRRGAGATTRRAAAAAPLRDAAQVREVLRSKRFLAADRAALDVREIGTWDRYLLREHRLLVPVDVQALYVPAGSTEKMVRLPMLVAGPNGESRGERRRRHARPVQRRGAARARRASALGDAGRAAARAHERKRDDGCEPARPAGVARSLGGVAARAAARRRGMCS